jgi:replicative DNA helicase
MMDEYVPIARTEFGDLDDEWDIPNLHAGASALDGDHRIGEREQPAADRYLEGGSFVLDAPATPAAVWGDEDRVIWAQGEAFLIVGPPGVGKTTLSSQLILAGVGLLDDVLGLPVRRFTRVLYLAMDRAPQIRRVFRRLVDEADRLTLDDRLTVWTGPPPRDFARYPETLTEMCRHAHADAVWLDSVKDAARNLSDDDTGSGLNNALQSALAAGFEVGGNHHQRKGQGGNKPKTLEDVYGSTWITAGAGSVVLLWGSAGDPIVDWTHLKQPAAEVGPWKVDHNHLTGRSDVYRGQADPLKVLNNRGARGITTTDLARVMFEGRNQPRSRSARRDTNSTG